MRKFKDVVKRIMMILTISVTLITFADSLASAISFTTAEGRIYLPAGRACSLTGEKSNGSDYLGYRLNDVWPKNGSEDTYTRVKLSAKYGSKTIMSERVIYESTTTSSYYYHDTADLSKGDSVAFYVRGNDSTLSAFCDIYLNWY